MEYLTVEPTPLLRPYVERYILINQSFPAEHRQTIRVLPSSTSQLAINLGTANTKPDDEGVLDRHYAIAVVGPFTRRHDYVMHGHIHSVVAYFTPIGLSALFSLDLAALADETMNFTHLRPTDASTLLDTIRLVTESRDKLQALERFLLNRLPLAKRPHPDVERAYNLIRQRRGNLTVQDLLTGLTLKQRAFERHFRQATGLTPKQFMRITRFLAVRSAIAARTYGNWHDVLHQGGYYDQAHFIREFTLFTGQTPSAYFAGDLGFDNFLLHTKP